MESLIDVLCGKLSLPGGTRQPHLGDEVQEKIIPRGIIRGNGPQHEGWMITGGGHLLVL